MTGVSYYGSGINLPDGIPFVVKNPAHWAFQGISPPLIAGDWFGIYCGDNVHSVIGGECDRIQPVPNDPAPPMQSPPNYTIASARDPRDSNEIATMGSFAIGAGEVFNAATIIWALALSDETGLWNKAPEITQNVIDRFTRERVLVPDVFGLSAAGAAQLVHAAGLVPKFTGPAQGSSWVSSQSPAAGQLVDPGSTVTMVLRTGPPP
jgi:hypothetical protein